MTAYRMRSNIIPRAMLTGAASLLVFAIGVASVSRITGANHIDLAPTYAVASRDLRFADRPDRGIDIRDVKTGAVIEEIPPKSGGFIRGAMRALLYNVHVGADQTAGHVFHLTRWADGRLSLEDAVTHITLELEAFGTDNERVFSNMLATNHAAPVQAAPVQTLSGAATQFGERK